MDKRLFLASLAINTVPQNDTCQPQYGHYLYFNYLTRSFWMMYEGENIALRF